MSAAQFPLLKEFVAFVRERYEIHRRRVLGGSAPWTKDPILAKYRFTNVLREDDRVTKWIMNHWLPNDPDAWFVAYVARVFNKPDTLTHIAPVLPWGRRRLLVLSELKYMRDVGHSKLFNAAYIVSTHRVKQPKLEYYAERFDDLWQHRQHIRPRKGDTLSSWAAKFTTWPGVGGFMAAQVVADIKYQDPLSRADDWYTFALSGPGSRRGLNRLMGREVRATWKEQAWHEQLLVLRGLVAPKFAFSLSAQNLQNCLCEFDKYCRAKYNEGEPKQLFRPTKEGSYVRLHSE